MSWSSKSWNRYVLFVERPPLSHCRRAADLLDVEPSTLVNAMSFRRIKVGRAETLLFFCVCVGCIIIIIVLFLFLFFVIGISFCNKA